MRNIQQRDRNIELDTSVGRLRGLIESFFPDDKNDIYDALSLCERVSSSFKDRYDGRPRFLHPVEVATDVIEFFGVRDKDMLIAAILHDVIEDQPEQVVGEKELPKEQRSKFRQKALELIEKQFGLRVRQLVEKLTNPVFSEKVEELRREGDQRPQTEIENEFYFQHFKRISKTDEDAFVVKIADFRKNALSIDQIPEGGLKSHLRARYLQPLSFLRGYLEGLTNQESPLFRVKDELLQQIDDIYAREYLLVESSIK